MVKLANAFFSLYKISRGAHELSDGLRDIKNEPEKEGISNLR